MKRKLWLIMTRLRLRKEVSMAKAAIAQGSDASVVASIFHERSVDTFNDLFRHVAIHSDEYDDVWRQLCPGVPQLVFESAVELAPGHVMMLGGKARFV